MPKYAITSPDGRKFEITAPEGATREQVIAYAKQKFAAEAPKQTPAYLLPENQTPVPALPGEGDVLPPSSPAPDRVPMSEGIALKAQGLGLGFGDEYAALLDAITSSYRDPRPFGDRYRSAQQYFDSRSKQFEAENPLASSATEAIVGALPALRAMKATSVAMETMEQAPGLLKRLGTAAATGGAFGGLSGYGNASPEERAAGALSGAALGAGFALGAGGIVEGLRPVVQALREPTRKMIGRVESMIAERFNGAPARAAAPAAAQAPALSDEATAAQSKILEAIERGKLTPQDVAGRMREQQALGKPVGIVDVAGENVRGLARGTVTLKGPARQTAADALNARSDGQRPRVMQDVTQGLRTPEQDVGALTEEIIQRRSAASGPAYRKAEAFGEVSDPELIDLMDQNPAFANAHNKARALLAGANKNIPELFNPETNQLIRYPTVADIDLIKKGLDRRLYNNKRGVFDSDEKALDPYFASLLEGERTKLLSRTDHVVPDYATARSQFAGETALAEALDAGREFMSVDPRQLRRVLAKMGDSEREMFRTGVVDEVRRRLARAADNADNANTVKSIAGYLKGEKIEALEPLFQSAEDFARFKAQMRSEIDMHQTRQYVMGGSQTANKMAEVDDMGIPAEVVGDAVVDVGGLNFKSAGMRIGRALMDNTVGRWKSGITEGQRSQIADELFNFTDADRAQDFLRQLDRVRMQREVSMRARGKTSSAAGALGGLAGGS